VLVGLVGQVLLSTAVRVAHSSFTDFLDFLSELETGPIAYNYLMLLTVT